jgi:hypothetical protein
VARLRNSISHLQSTQSELRSFLEEDEDGDEDGEIGLAIDENEVTMYVPLHLHSSLPSFHPIYWPQVYSCWIKLGVGTKS